MDLSLKLDFGAGKLTPLTHDGRQWVRLDDLAKFLEGDRSRVPLGAVPVLAWPATGRARA